MKCERARELIGREYDDALPPSDRDSLEAHMSGCDACRVFRVQMDAVVAGLDDLRSLTDIAIGHEAAPGGVPRIRRFAGTLRIAAMVALFVAGGLVATWLLTEDRDRPVSTSGHLPVAHAAHEFEVRLTAESRDRLIPVVKPTDHPRVHLVWLYTALPTPGGDQPRSAIENPSGDGAGQSAHGNPDTGSSRDGDPLA